MPQQQRDTGKLSNSEAFGLLFLVLNSHKVCLAVFMRRGFGTRAFDPYSIVALAGLLVLAAAHRWMRLYLAAWFIMLIWRRIESFRLRWKGQDGHSEYQGYPWLGMRWPGVTTEKAAKEAEPFICLLAGAVLFTIYPPLGAFVAFGFVSFLGCLFIGRFTESQRLRALRDAEIEMRYYSEKYRERG